MSFPSSFTVSHLVRIAASESAKICAILERKFGRTRLELARKRIQVLTSPQQFVELFQIYSRLFATELAAASSSIWEILNERREITPMVTPLAFVLDKSTPGLLSLRIGNDTIARVPDFIVDSLRTKFVGKEDFEGALAPLLTRYGEIFDPAGRISANMHAAVPSHIYRSVARCAGGEENALELFASPINSTFQKYFSAFPEVDSPFGSLGTFTGMNTVVPAGTTAIFANPPYVEEVMNTVARFLVEHKARRPEIPIFAILPKWDYPQLDANRILSAGGFRQVELDGASFVPGNPIAAGRTIFIPIKLIVSIHGIDLGDILKTWASTR
jgi:hypothetical protein